MTNWYLVATLFAVLLVYALLLRESHRLHLERQEHDKTRADLRLYKEVEILTSTPRGTTAGYTSGSTVLFAIQLERAIHQFKPISIGHEVAIQWLPDIEPGKVRIVIQQHLPTRYERMVGRTKRTPAPIDQRREVSLMWAHDHTPCKCSHARMVHGPGAFGHRSVCTVCDCDGFVVKVE